MKKMDYKTFDVGCYNDIIKDKIIQLLRKKPMTGKELIKEIGCTPNQLNPQRYKLMQRKIITKQYFNGMWYYGIHKSKR